VPLHRREQAALGQKHRRTAVEQTVLEQKASTGAPPHRRRTDGAGAEGQHWRTAAPPWNRRCWGRRQASTGAFRLVRLTIPWG